VTFVALVSTVCDDEPVSNGGDEGTIVDGDASTDITLDLRDATVGDLPEDADAPNDAEPGDSDVELPDSDAAQDMPADPDAADGDGGSPDLHWPDLPTDISPEACFSDADPCPDGFNCFCGGPGPIGACFCGQQCETADDCQDPARPICCGDTCTTACECFCD